MTHCRYLLATLVAMGLLIGPFGAAAQAQALPPPPPYVVNSAGDPGVGSCNSTECTLREAINASNGSPGFEEIHFDLPGGSLLLQPVSGLPAITDPVLLDGTTQPGYAGTPIVQLDGSSSAAVPGLSLTGGGTTVRGLVISDWGQEGIRITGGSGNTVQGNYIGTTATGNAGASNGTIGLSISGTSGSNVIGGSGSDEGNVISANGSDGVRITGPATSMNVLRGNYIGITLSGTTDLGNNGNGLTITDSSNNVIGGTGAGFGNLISGNNQNGILIESPGGAGLASGNQIFGNVIGTNATGTGVVNNTVAGVRMEDGAQSTQVGNGTAAGRNVISGNNSRGVDVLGATSSGNSILGNYIGTNMAGNAALGNTLGGVGITDAPNTVIGASGAGNLISGNTGNGIQLSGITVTGTLIQGNFVGTNAAGTARVQNGGAGITISNSPSNLIGGTGAGQGNVVSGNNFNGIRILGAATTGTQVFGNVVGATPNGLSPVGQGQDGVLISSDANGTQVGGLLPGQSNRIAFNIGDGVRVASGSENVIRGNSITGNDGSGIDLEVVAGGGGVTPNDPGDADAGGNDLTNFPDLTQAVSRANETTLTGSYSGEPLQSFNVDVYGNTSCDSMGHGEGATYIDTFMITTDASGVATFDAPISPPIAAGTVLTTTATNITTGSTSEFSACRTVRAVHADLSMDMTVPATSPITGQNATYTLTIGHGGPDPDTANNVVVTDVLPATLVPVSATSSQGSCNRTGQTFTCNVGSIAQDDSVTITVVAQTTTPYLVTNVASVDSDTFDPDMTNNTDSVGLVPRCTRNGTARKETLRGKPGVDVICGKGGNDTILGLGGNDLLFGGPGNDRIDGGNGIDKLYGEAGRDTLLGYVGNDTLFGGTESDSLTGGGGNDVLQGDAGIDVVLFNDSKKAVVANLTKGRATGNGTDTLRLLENLTGSNFKDTLTGTGGVNVLTGGRGADKLFGMGGKDTIYARDRTKDTIDGGKGADRAQHDRVDAVKSVERHIR
jgi:CSLREA domain-containing protein/uncharacterized repeat protein (TIGR01451 family)